MKTTIMIVLLLLFCAGTATFAADFRASVTDGNHHEIRASNVPEDADLGEQAAKRFKVVFTIQFNSMTLEEAAKQEKELKTLFKHYDCNVDVDLGDNNITTTDGSGLIFHY